MYSVFFLIRPQEILGVLANMPIPLERITAIFVLIVIFFKYKLQRSTKLSLNNISYSMMAYVFVALLTVTTAIWIEHAFEIWMKLCILLIVFFMITSLIDSRKYLDYYIGFIVFTSTFHASGSIFNYYNGIYQYRMGIKRAIGMDVSYGGPNALAATMVYTLPFIYYFYKQSTSMVVRLFLLACTCTLLWCIILTGSRTGMIGAIFFALLLVWESKNKIINLIFVIILSMSFWVLMPSEYQERLLSSTDIESGSSSAESASGRISGLISGYKLLSNRPLLGYGIGCFAIAHDQVLDRGWFQSHSLPGQIMGELGLLGILAFIVWMYYLFKNLKILGNNESPDKKLRIQTKYLAISLRMQLLCLFMLGLAGHNLYRYNWFIISAIIVILLKLLRNAKQT
ncbi:MAG: hypothetical protein GY865_17510 [candidate division Zixibacteria bacterium]|nr:hypothetical protein [candidate division Zixibacteria bacterium]